MPGTTTYGSTLSLREFGGTEYHSTHKSVGLDTVATFVAIDTLPGHPPKGDCGSLGLGTSDSHSEGVIVSNTDSTTSTTSTLATLVGSAEAFATLRGLKVAKPEASVEERSAAIVALATDGEAVKANLAAEVDAHKAYIAAKQDAQETRANLAIAMRLLSEEGIQNTALAERFALPGGKSAVPTWLRFAEWVLSSVAAGGKRNVASGDAAVRAEALSEGWNAILAAKKAGAMNDKSFIEKVTFGAAPSSLREAATAIKAEKDAAKAPKEPVAPVEPSSGTNTGATEPSAPVAPVVPGTTVAPAPEEPQESESLDADTLRNVAAVTATMERIHKAVLLGTLESATLESVFQTVAEWTALADGLSEAVLAVLEDRAGEAEDAEAASA